jgi:hypothetical protein
MSHIVQYEDEGAIKHEGAEDVAPTYVCKCDHETRDKEESCSHKQVKGMCARLSYIDRRLYLADTEVLC